MINFAFHERTKEAAKEAMLAKARECSDDLFTEAHEAAAAAMLDAMPDIPKGGSVLISLRFNIPLGGYTDNMLVEIAFHPHDLTKLDKPQPNPSRPTTAKR